VGLKLLISHLQMKCPCHIRYSCLAAGRGGRRGNYRSDLVIIPIDGRDRLNSGEKKHLRWARGKGVGKRSCRKKKEAGVWSSVKSLLAVGICLRKGGFNLSAIREENPPELA